MSTTRIIAWIAALGGTIGAALVFAVPGRPFADGSASAGPLPHSWPPVVGETYPSLDLTMIDGKAFDFESLRGKVVLLEATALTSPGSIGFAGIDDFQGGRAQQNLRSTHDLFLEYNIDPANEDLRFVQVLFYDTQAGYPTPARARRWAADTGLAEREHTVLLLGDARYISSATLAMVPGFQLLDRDLILRADGAGTRAPDNIYDVVFPQLADLLGSPGKPKAVVVVAAPTPPPTRPANADSRKLLDHLVEEDYDAFDVAYAELRRAGRGVDSYRDRAHVALTDLASFPAALQQLDGWLRRRPNCAAARITSGQRWIYFAWAARGSGFADTVDPRGWKLFAERLERAESELQHAMRLDPGNPDGAIRLITVAMGLQRDEATALRYYRRAVELDPTNMHAHSGYFTSLLPRWSGGTYQRVAKLVGRIRTTLDGDPAADLFGLRLHSAIAQMTESGADYLKQDQVAQAIRRARKSLEISYPADSEPWVFAGSIERVLGNRSRAHQYRLRAAELGDGHQALSQGLRLLQRNNTAKEQKEGFEWLVRSATLAHPKAFAFVGSSYVHGLGVASDDELARQWFEAGIAAEQSRSMHGLGTIFENGYGVSRDLRKALYWYDRAGVEFDNGRAARDRLLRENPDLALEREDGRIDRRPK